jgi:hypothetical protein
VPRGDQKMGVLPPNTKASSPNTSKQWATNSPSGRGIAHGIWGVEVTFDRGTCPLSWW